MGSNVSSGLGTETSHSQRNIRRMETQDGNERQNERAEETNRKSQLFPVAKNLLLLCLLCLMCYIICCFGNTVWSRSRWSRSRALHVPARLSSASHISAAGAKLSNATDEKDVHLILHFFLFVRSQIWFFSIVKCYNKPHPTSIVTSKTK